MIINKDQNKEESKNQPIATTFKDRTMFWYPVYEKGHSLRNINELTPKEYEVSDGEGNWYCSTCDRHFLIATNYR